MAEGRVVRDKRYSVSYNYTALIDEFFKNYESVQYQGTMISSALGESAKALEAKIYTSTDMLNKLQKLCPDVKINDINDYKDVISSVLLKFGNEDNFNEDKILYVIADSINHGVQNVINKAKEEYVKALEPYGNLIENYLNNIKQPSDINDYNFTIFLKEKDLSEDEIKLCKSILLGYLAENAAGKPSYKEIEKAFNKNKYGNDGLISGIHTTRAQNDDNDTMNFVQKGLNPIGNYLHTMGEISYTYEEAKQHSGIGNEYLAQLTSSPIYNAIMLGANFIPGVNVVAAVFDIFATISGVTWSIANDQEAYGQEWLDMWGLEGDAKNAAYYRAAFEVISSLLGLIPGGKALNPKNIMKASKNLGLCLSTMGLSSFKALFKDITSMFEFAMGTIGTKKNLSVICKELSGGLSHILNKYNIGDGASFIESILMQLRANSDNTSHEDDTQTPPPSDNNTIDMGDGSVYNPDEEPEPDIEDDGMSDDDDSFSDISVNPPYDNNDPPSTNPPTNPPNLPDDGFGSNHDIDTPTAGDMPGLDGSQNPYAPGGYNWDGTYNPTPDPNGDGGSVIIDGPSASGWEFNIGPTNEDLIIQDVITKCDEMYGSGNYDLRIDFNEADGTYTVTVTPHNDTDEHTDDWYMENDTSGSDEDNNKDKDDPSKDYRSK